MANRVLEKMLDRLFGALMSGPNLNCRPQASRQRIDLTQLAKLQDLSPEETLRQLLGEKREAKIVARVLQPKRLVSRRRLENTKPLAPDEGNENLTPVEREAERKWLEQSNLLKKLRSIAEDAKTYEQDTGVQVLSLGFPLLSLPPGAWQGTSRRLLAPIAFIPVTLAIKGGATQSLQLTCIGEGTDLVTPNAALFAWMEQQTGVSSENLFSDEQGGDPTREISELIQHVARMLEIKPPNVFSKNDSTGEFDNWLANLLLESAPKAEDAPGEPSIIPAGVLGLFPMANQGLLRDTQAMLSEVHVGPLQSFLKVGVSLDAPVSQEEIPEAATVSRRASNPAEDRLIALADPCQGRAVRLARSSTGLVVHGPPGTGKSQTITNVIGDHLFHGQRVLFVCEKRTALDVVFNRLQHLGLGHLCAVIHDPLRDRRSLYKSVREQLEALPDLKSDAHAEVRLQEIDRELSQLHREMSEHHSALMEKGNDGHSFHELMGQWLSIPTGETTSLDSSLVESVQLASLESNRRKIEETLERAARVNYHENPWSVSAGILLPEFLATPMDRLRQGLNACSQAAKVCDSAAHGSIPSFVSTIDIRQQGSLRADLADRLRNTLVQTDQSILAFWAQQSDSLIERTQMQIAILDSSAKVVAAGPLDMELASIAISDLPTLAHVGQQLLAVESYLRITDRLLGFFHFRTNAQARQVLSRFGLRLSPENASRIKVFLQRLKARLLLCQFLNNLLENRTVAEPTNDLPLQKEWETHRGAIELFTWIKGQPALSHLQKDIRAAFEKPETSDAFFDGLKQSKDRAIAIHNLEQSIRASRLFMTEWIDAMYGKMCEGARVNEVFGRLTDTMMSLEDVLRCRSTINDLPQSLREPVAVLMKQHVSADIGIQTLCQAALANRITELLKTSPQLQAMDAHRLKSSFDRYRRLQNEQMQCVRAVIINRWAQRQRERLLASTGSRLNTQGADLRRRLTMRGERAMRLRQVVAAGQEIEGGDPLFDLCPIWMASPEAVAQIFPREAIFDALIFDEASQCRLEEALPVLTRARRIVIAGDQKQLPPTRFFESAVMVSSDEEPETDQELFETQQAEVEDLLGASLNVEIQECYLDVHYRSRNADLIHFSNEHFYGSRLQAIPGHPSRKSRFAPLTLYQVNGVYEDRCNLAEADQVCRIVHDLLRRAEPPSIGVACFNLQQRDLIVERMDEMALSDPEFAKRLAESRNRRGEGSFEGLFVRNLENVQGDERDHMIISTTYGPDPQGKFYRRFGPLGLPGGGRRLNVLVTRARQEVHLVSSIPRDVYHALPPLAPGQLPGGGWLLFSYLAYAESLKNLYEVADTETSGTRVDKSASIKVREAKAPSAFSTALARNLAEQHGIGSDVHWGNEGFSIDLALHHPNDAENVTIGVLCDGCRFDQAEDPLAWDIFRTAIHEAQGWKLHRLWTPHFFRDSQGSMQAILNDARSFLDGDDKTKLAPGR